MVIQKDCIEYKLFVDKRVRRRFESAIKVENKNILRVKTELGTRKKTRFRPRKNDNSQKKKIDNNQEKRRKEMENAN